MDPNGPGWTSVACGWVQLKFWDGPSLGPVQWCGCRSRFPLENRVKIDIFLDYFASSLQEYLYNTVQTLATFMSPLGTVMSPPAGFMSPMGTFMSPWVRL